MDLELGLQGFRLSTLTKTVEIAALCQVPVYDSYFLAMALESESVLVTADDACFRKARHYPSIVSLRQLRLPD